MSDSKLLSKKSGITMVVFGGILRFISIILYTFGIIIFRQADYISGFYGMEDLVPKAIWAGIITMVCFILFAIGGILLLIFGIRKLIVISLQNSGNVIVLKKERKTVENKTISDRHITENYVSIADELKKYKDLLDKSIITQEEFDAKKKQLLGL